MHRPKVHHTETIPTDVWVTGRNPHLPSFWQTLNLTLLWDRWHSYVTVHPRHIRAPSTKYTTSDYQKSRGNDLRTQVTPANLHSLQMHTESSKPRITWPSGMTVFICFSTGYPRQWCFNSYIKVRSDPIDPSQCCSPMLPLDALATNFRNGLLSLH